MPKSKKAQKKISPKIKSGHPAKVKEQRVALADYEKARQNHIRSHKNRIKEKTIVPQNVGSIYQPPPHVEPLESYVPAYSPPKKSTNKSGKRKTSKGKLISKIVAWSIVIGVSGSLIVTTLFIPDPTLESIINQENEAANQNVDPFSNPFTDKQNSSLQIGEGETVEIPSEKVETPEDSSEEKP